MTTVFDSPVYAEARVNRLRNLFAHVDPATLTGKRILEVGCGTGELGQELIWSGVDLVSIDARPEHIEELHKRFPGRKAFVADAESWELLKFGTFDAVLCWGVLYHLRNPHIFLERCFAIAPVLYLETQVTDSDEIRCPLLKESGADQSYCGIGSRPTPAWLDQVLRDAGYQVEDISGTLANWPGAVFDWTPQNDGQSMRDGNMLRKMYVCRREA